jgi:hypothetical protein
MKTIQKDCQKFIFLYPKKIWFLIRTMLMNITLKNKFTQTLATGAAAIGVLAGVGLVGAPAQAGTFSLTAGPYGTPFYPPFGTGGTPPGTTLCNNTNTPCIRDTESPALGSPEPIWRTFPPVFPPPGSDPVGYHGTPGVDGWDNPAVSHSGSTDGYFLIEYFGSGTSTQTNNFFWNGESLFGSSPGIICDDNNFGSVCKHTTRPLQNGLLPFYFTTNLPSLNNTTYNGEQPEIINDDVTGAHYFATLTGSWADATNSNVVYLGFSDGNGGSGTGDDDAADYVIRITSVQQKVPEPGTILGLLAVGGLGVAMKRKKQG